MAENKTKPTKVAVSTFLGAIKDETKRADAKALSAMMQKAVGEKATMWGPAIVGFGAFSYAYESGRTGEMPLLGFSPRAAALTLYGAISFEGADTLLEKLGKYTTGKGCLYIKKMADVDAKVLEKILAKAAKARRAKGAA